MNPYNQNPRRNYMGGGMPMGRQPMPRMKWNKAVVNLIIVNLVVFAIINLFLMIGRVSGSGIGEFVFRLFVMPVDLGGWIWRFWTPVTSIFSQQGFWHLLGNMIFLMIGGRLIAQFAGSKALVTLYFGAGLIAAFTVMAIYSVLSPGHPAVMLGASGAVYAIVVAAAVLRPDHVIHLFIFGPIKLKWFVAIFVFLFMFLNFDIDIQQNPGGTIAHLIGIAVGAYWAHRYNHYHNILGWMHRLLERVGIMNFFLTDRKFKNPFKGVSNGRNTPQYTGTQEMPRQYNIDQILDKINKSGMKSLSKSEKEYLVKNSKKM